VPVPGAVIQEDGLNREYYQEHTRREPSAAERQHKVAEAPTVMAAVESKMMEELVVVVSVAVSGVLVSIGTQSQRPEEHMQHIPADCSLVAAWYLMQVDVAQMELGRQSIADTGSRVSKWETVGKASPPPAVRETVLGWPPGCSVLERDRSSWFPLARSDFLDTERW
jgi:hypothetical protein